MKLRCALLLTCWAASAAGATLEDSTRRMDADFAAGRPLVAHVVVALCDNEYQGIVPVAQKLGDGSAPQSNLYWGAMYGVRTWFRKSAEWRSVDIASGSAAPVLDRALFRREMTRAGKRGEVYLYAEAWEGRHIADAIQRFFELNRGRYVETLEIPGRRLNLGGAAHLLAFVGHNGLMDFATPQLPAARDMPAAHTSVVLACFSDEYFSPVLRAHGEPLIMTSGLMAPEAYTLDAIVSSWFAGAPPSQVRLEAARSYAHHQRIPERAAMRLFLTRRAHPSP